jgi:hypothetical protein
MDYDYPQYIKGTINLEKCVFLLKKHQPSPEFLKLAQLGLQ